MVTVPRKQPNVSQLIHESGPTRKANPSKPHKAFSIIIQLTTQHLSAVTTAAKSYSDPEFTEPELSFVAQPQNVAKHF